MCLGNWRKNEVKTTQHTIVYHTHIIQILRRSEISANYCCTEVGRRVQQNTILELHLQFLRQIIHGTSVEVILVTESFL